MRDRSVISRAVVALATSLVVACSAPASTPVPTGPAPATTIATFTASASPDPTAAVSPEPTPEPTATASSTPAAAAPLIVDWTRRRVDGLDGLTEIRASVAPGGTALLVGTVGEVGTDQSRSAIWRSTNGRDWDRVLDAPNGQRLFAITAGGPGFVAVGTDDRRAIVWTSQDGTRWQPTLDDAFARGSMGMIVRTRSGLVAFGHRRGTDSRVIWTSPDGIEWLAATNETGLWVARGVQAVAAIDGRAIAFVGRDDDMPGPVEVWSTTGRAEWEQVGTLPDAEATITKAAAGPRGWVAIGSAGADQPDTAWFSVDGTTWERAETGPDVSGTVIGVEAGFVVTGAVGSLLGDTCGDQRDHHGHTWTSADGRTWQRMRPSPDFEWASIDSLHVVGSNLVGIGGRYPGEHSYSSFVPTRWTAPLPATSRAHDTSDRPSDRQTCGG